MQSLADSLGITLLRLPSYSPNLNLIERLWKFVKKTALNSRSYDTFVEFQTAIDQCLDELFTAHAAAVKTLLTLSPEEGGEGTGSRPPIDDCTLSASSALVHSSLPALRPTLAIPFPHSQNEFPMSTSRHAIRQSG